MTVARPPFGFGSLVTESLRMAWRLKALWIFGIFLSGETGGSIQEIMDLEDWDDGPFLGDWGFIPEVELAAAILIISGFLIFLLAMFAMYLISEGGLIQAGSEYAVGRYVRVGDTWRSGVRHMLSILLLALINLFVWVFAILTGVGLAILVGVAMHPLMGVFVGLFSVPLFILFAIFYIPLYSYTLRAVVLEGHDPITAWSLAMGTVRSNLSRTALVSLVRFVFTLVATAAGTTVAIMLIAPVVMLWFIWPPIAILGALVIALPILIIISGYLGCAGSYYWTLAYMWARGMSPAGEESMPLPVSDTPAPPPAPAPPA